MIQAKKCKIVLDILQKPPGQTCTFEGFGASNHHQNSTRRHPEIQKKERNAWGSRRLRPECGVRCLGCGRVGCLKFHVFLFPSPTTIFFISFLGFARGILVVCIGSDSTQASYIISGARNPRQAFMRGVVWTEGISSTCCKGRKNAKSGEKKKAKLWAVLVGRKGSSGGGGGGRGGFKGSALTDTQQQQVNTQKTSFVLIVIHKFDLLKPGWLKAVSEKRHSGM